jgi:lysophospholipase L1-like esterase
MKLLFLGDSLVAFSNWQSRFPLHAVVNAGRAGETAAGLLAALPRHLHCCPDPDRVFIMIGTNNLLREEYAFLPDYQKILTALANTLPPARITVTGLPPFRAAHLAPSAVPRVNQGLLQLSRRNKTAFLDLFAAFSAETTDTSACFTDDGVHLSPLGYEIWSARLARGLE